MTLCYQAILRSLYAYFMDKPLKEVPHIQVLVSIAAFLNFNDHKEHVVLIEVKKRCSMIVYILKVFSLF